MATNVIIVESPAKIKKIESFLGADYECAASYGHIMGIDDKKLGIDIENNFQPDYIILTDKADKVAKLKKITKNAVNIYLAADPDREGHAIAYSVKKVLGIKTENEKRITFNQITKKAILDALKNPTKIDMNQVYSQMCRSVLDKLIGYKVSPTLWKQFNNYHLSAGRVQSVAAKIIMERESEISKFSKEQFYTIEANFQIPETNITLASICDSTFTNADQIRDIFRKCLEIDPSSSNDKLIKYVIDNIKESKSTRNPSPPYITSSMQQDASSKLGMSPDTTMKLAQQLYEGGHITYMRTDSTALSEEALTEIKDFVIATYGEEYYHLVKYKPKAANAQEAHEACRPTHINLKSVSGKEGMTNSHNRLYQMIWRRTVACQMAPAKVDNLNIKIKTIGDDIPHLSSNSNTNSQITEITDEASEATQWLGEGAKRPSESTTIKKKTTKGKKKAKTEENSTNNGLVFTTKFEKVTFPGFLKVYQNSTKTEETTDEANEDDGENTAANKTNIDIMDQVIAKLQEGSQVTCLGMSSKEKYTKPPHPRYNEASLVKKLEELGIGRPSTYASIIDRIQVRQYVEIKTIEPKTVEGVNLEWSKVDNKIKESKVMIKLDGEKNKLFPTNLGTMITDFLNNKFTSFMDYGFTAQVELLLDEIADGKKIWYKVVDSVYQVIKPTILELEANYRASNGGSDTSGMPVYRTIGKHPTKGCDINVITSKYGYSICMLDPDTNKKQYANVKPNCQDSITIEDAIKLLNYPRSLGNYQEKEVKLCSAHNLYLKWNNGNYSIENYNKSHPEATISPDEITIDQAILVIENHKKASSGIKVSDTITIKSGIYGPYIPYEGINVKVPAKYKSSLDQLDEKTCLDIIEKYLNKKGKSKDSEPKKTKHIKGMESIPSSNVINLSSTNDLTQSNDTPKPRAKTTKPTAKTTKPATKATKPVNASKAPKVTKTIKTEDPEFDYEM